MDIIKRIKYLKKLLNKNNYLYYIKQNPELSDGEYDTYFRELLKLENLYPQYKDIDSPTHRIGAKPSTEFKITKHLQPMMSLSDCFNEEEFHTWHNRNSKILKNQNFEMVSELKIDGLAISLIYENSKLKTASTRGNGNEGEDVTSNARTIKTIPLNLNKNIPGNIEIRGEVFISKSQFTTLNIEREKNNLPKYSNPRNCASGSLRQLDPIITKSRRLDTFIYSIGYYDSSILLPETQYDRLKFLSELGFKTNNNTLLSDSLEDTINIYKSFEKKIPELDYLCDGLVIKVNNINSQNIIGELTRSPKWAIAFKYPGNRAITQIKDIEINIGRTGTINPIANLVPIELDGVTITNATLHNPSYIEKLDLKIGDWVYIERAGDVIPKVLSVIKNKRNGLEKKFIFPIICPSCNSKIVRNKSDAIYYCLNNKCITKIKRSIEYFVSKNAMDVEGLGPSIIEKLVSNKIINNFADIYYLKKEDLLKLDGFGIKSAENLIHSIENSKNRSSVKLLVALGINHIGNEMSDLILNKFESIKNLYNLNYDHLLEIPQIGPQIATSIIEYFNDDDNRAQIDKLINLGLNYKNRKSSNINSNLLGFNFVITGKLEKFTRSEIKDLILSLGGKVSSNITKNIDYLIAGTDPGSKLEKATELKIKIINENEFKILIK